MSSRRTTADALLDGLNDAQREAVMHRDGPLLVLAGPGSGKTRVITHRAAYLVRTGVPPASVLAITFTNKAADEMKRRIAELGAARGMWVYTFHALGVRLLREFGALARVAPGFTIYDESDRLRVVKDAMEKAGIPDTYIKPEDAQWSISRWKNELKGPQQAAGEISFAPEARRAAEIYEVYEKLLVERNAVDFDDLLMRPALVLRESEALRARLSMRFRYVLIDEYQDTNHAQYLIARFLAESHRNICATGDPDQSIYGWRGANIGNILEFERDYPEAVVVRLEQNYRSTGRILQVASQLIRSNKQRRDKELWTKGPEGGPVRVWRFGTGDEEAREIAAAIVAEQRAGRAWSDIAVFYRVNALSRGLEECLRDAGIPYRIARGVEFYNRKEIRDLLSYLRLLTNPRDDVALLRVINTPARGIGKTTIERLVRAAAEHGRPLTDMVADPHVLASLRTGEKHVARFATLLDQLRMRFARGGRVAELVGDVLSLSGLERSLAELGEEGGEDRLANARELVTAATRYEEQAEEPTLEEFLSRVALTSDQDRIEDAGGTVLLMTLHAAKGLEFPVVFVVGVEQGLLPHERSLRSRGGNELEEERRLCFVGITRAKEQLTLSHAQVRLVRGAFQGGTASQFLYELPEDALEQREFQTFASGVSGGRFGGSAFGGSRPPRESDGFVPMDDHAPIEPLATRRGKVRRDEADDGEPVFTPNEPTRPIPVALPADKFARWREDMRVFHAKFGEGWIQRITRNPGSTSAVIRFPKLGDKTFILEFAPLKLLPD